MKKLTNEYFYSSNPKEDGLLTAVHEKRNYKTKMLPEDLPEWYCSTHRAWWTHCMVNTKGVVDVKYTWVKENHFMKDSMLYISYTDKIGEEHQEYTINGKKLRSPFTNYTNVGSIVFGNDIFKCLAYIKKYSGTDISAIRKQFVKQCWWLKENEPEFAPDTDNYGKLFDEMTEFGKWLN